ncbi:MAG TPA: DUF3466 family protein [Psychromonas sp.]
MKCKVTLAGMALLLAGNSWAAGVPYYSVEEISVSADGANYGPYPSAISEDGAFIAAYSMKASLSQDIDLGLPFTFNRPCQYDTVMCELEFYGSETSSALSYNNAYQAWRNAQTDAQYGSYSSYMMGNTLSSGSDNGAVLPYDLGGYTTDVKVTDVFVSGAGDKIVIGYSSAPYVGGERAFVRRAFIYNQTQNIVNSLLPDFDTDGGFSSAYRIKQVGDKILVVGASSVSFPQDDDSNKEKDYFNSCYFSDEYDQVATLNELVYCPGFDTQAWAWDVTDYLTKTAEAGISGSALAAQWLDDNEDNNNSNITYSASALDINGSGIAVGVSTFEYTNTELGARQRATIMPPNYAAPLRIKAAEQGISDPDDNLYNTWASAINEANIVIGNREYSAVKSRNKPVEFFVYDISTGSISFPLLDKKVQTTAQRLSRESSAKTGANSRAYDINESGFIVGKADGFDQIEPVTGGAARSQSAFLYDNNTGKSWFINDLICSETDDVVTSPLYRIRSARVINDNGTVLAEGWKYNSVFEYQNKVNGSEVMLKLTRNADVLSPDDSPNCWDAALFDNIDTPYERQGAASFWVWLFALPLLIVRRFIK